LIEFNDLQLTTLMTKQNLSFIQLVNSYVEIDMREIRLNNLILSMSIKKKKNDFCISFFLHWNDCFVHQGTFDVYTMRKHIAM